MDRAKWALVPIQSNLAISFSGPGSTRMAERRSVAAARPTPTGPADDLRSPPRRAGGAVVAGAPGGISARASPGIGPDASVPSRADYPGATGPGPDAGRPGDSPAGSESLLEGRRR